MRMIVAEQKSRRKFDECWMKFVNEYQRISNNFKFSPLQKFQCFLNILHKDVLLHFLDCVKQVETDFQQAVNMIAQEYNSPVYLTRVVN